ncbi:histidine kinase dimerization and phosphoacceptor region [Gordonia neofelifaecis NRRL B-59395]|uniref:histidine kinase n=1 Tax=Gordonia neofelifaecis NRRL B-59395 TaxID=644548 RepID=F1YEK5_9ACTN|nr:histidine kinase dimerization and phosphoacceptor region [Gordonia neofelifaecis NRRL B-59395]
MPSILLNRDAVHISPPNDPGSAESRGSGPTVGRGGTGLRRDTVADVQPEDYQPPLTWRSHLWRLALVLAISGVAWGTDIGYQWEHVRWWFFLDLVLGIASLVAVHWRRSYPVAVAVGTNVASLVSASAAGPSMLALVSLATRRRWREIVPVGFVAVLCAMGSQLWTTPNRGETSAVDYVVIAVTMLLMIAWGLYIGSRRELLASWRSRAKLAEAEQEARVQHAKAAERGRIAREMHDVLAHRISTVHMYAGALAFREDLSAEQVHDAARTIEEMSATALTELREVLGVLRDDPGDAAPERPQAGAGDVDCLVEESRDYGMNLDYSCDADLTTLPEGAGRTLYRCVQEGLTNARKHAPATAVVLRITGTPGQGVELSVSNPLPIGEPRSVLPESGFGLVGLAERVELAGGRQSAHLTADERFVLRVWLPWHV